MVTQTRRSASALYDNALTVYDIAVGKVYLSPSSVHVACFRDSPGMAERSNDG